MKSLILVCGLLAVLAVAVAASCGPQNPYCPTSTTGLCRAGIDAGMMTQPDVGLGGDAVIVE